MKNKNAILLELSTEVVGSLFSKLYQREHRWVGFDVRSLPALIEEECEKQAHAYFADQKEGPTERDMFLMKMHAVNFYDKHFSKILADKVEDDRRKDA